MINKTTLCHIIDRKSKRLLLKMATRGISKGKWNALGGKIDDAETPKESAAREAR